MGIFSIPQKFNLVRGGTLFVANEQKLYWPLVISETLPFRAMVLTLTPHFPKRQKRVIFLSVHRGCLTYRYQVSLRGLPFPLSHVLPTLLPSLLAFPPAVTFPPNPAPPAPPPALPSTSLPALPSSPPPAPLLALSPTLPALPSSSPHAGITVKKMSSPFSC